MILHIAHESIFLDYAIRQFEKAAPGRNEYIVLVKDVNSLRQKEIIRPVLINSDEYNKLHLAFLNYEAIIIHALTAEKIPLVLRAAHSVVFVWMLWGGDGYSIKKMKFKLYSISTENILKDIGLTVSKTLKIKERMLLNFPVILRLLKNKWPSEYLKIKAVRRMNYIAPVIYEDFDIIRKLLNLSAEYLPFSYGSIADFIFNYNDRIVTNCNAILVGHSADPANNHIDVFKFLKNNDSDSNIICPLSYGNKNYAEEIIKIGKRMFDKRFCPIVNFLPLKDYTELLCTCRYAFMNQYRQQAIGNIIMLLWLGSTVVLNKKNPAYSYLCKNQINILEFSDVESKKHFSSLSDIEWRENRQALIKLYSEEQVLQKTKQFIKILESGQLLYRPITNEMSR